MLYTAVVDNPHTRVGERLKRGPFKEEPVMTTSAMGQAMGQT